MRVQTKPGDLIGRDDDGHIRIDRVIPLPWLLGLAGLLAMNLATMWFGQRELATRVTELAQEVKEARLQAATLNTRDAAQEQRMADQDRRMSDHDRRLTELERGDRERVRGR